MRESPVQSELAEHTRKLFDRPVVFFPARDRYASDADENRALREVRETEPSFECVL